MSILENAVHFLEKADATRDIATAVQKLIDAQDPLDIGAAAGELAASLASGFAIHGLLRPAFSGIRIGLAISGQIGKWDALTKAAGIIGGIGSGQLIDFLNGLELGGRIYDWLQPDPLTNTNWRTATTPPRRDPLAIDLDGDGIETVGIPLGGNPILFDHDADGVKTGTGWLKGDDAWVVLDRDGNGSIDSGRELFGVDTLITLSERIPGTFDFHTVTRNARNGFEALRSLDTGNGIVGSAGYGDGVFNANDAAFTQVKLWQE